MRPARLVWAATALALWTAGLVTSSGASAAEKTVPDGHAKPSSYAPQPRSPNRAYGAPIQRPVLTKHKRTRHRTDKPPSSTAKSPAR
jgi:hypothetical protein